MVLSFMIILCTAIVNNSVEVLKIASLVSSTICKDNIITSVFETTYYITKILVDDCGGHGRALETLQEILKNRDIKKVNVNDLMKDLRVCLHDRYNDA